MKQGIDRGGVEKEMMTREREKLIEEQRARVREARCGKREGAKLRGKVRY